jgi:hypothetical protein
MWCLRGGPSVAWGPSRGCAMIGRWARRSSTPVQGARLTDVGGAPKVVTHMKTWFEHVA